MLHALMFVLDILTVSVCFFCFFSLNGVHAAVVAVHWEAVEDRVALVVSVSDVAIVAGMLEEL